MFDCGAGGFTDVGNATLVPALHSLGVTRIDSLFISHSDLDHICGALDVADHVPVGRALVTPQFTELAEKGLADAAEARVPGGPDAPEAPVPAGSFLLRGLRRRGIPVEVVSRGWHEELGCAQAELLWPTASYRPPTPRDTNDTCLVLSLRAAGRRILLNGDIQQRAMTGMFNLDTDLSADVVDLPHHGSFNPASIEWLHRAGPAIVLQSSGDSRLRPGADHWRDVLAPTPIGRLVAARLGMVELTIDPGGKIAWQSFKRAAAADR
jgi:competence protein ComEC